MVLACLLLYKKIFKKELRCQALFQSLLYFPRYGSDRNPLWKKYRWLRGDNYVNTCLQGTIMVLVHCPSTDCHLSINQVPFQSLLYFPWYGPDRDQLWKKQWLRELSTVNIQGRIMGLVHGTSSHCHLSINQVSFQSLLYFPRYGPGRQHLWKNGYGEIAL